MMRIIALVVVVASLVSGCGGSSDSAKPGTTGKSTQESKPATQEALRKAIQQGDFQAVQAGLDGGVSASEVWYGESPIHEAARSGKKEIVEALLAKGADPKAQSQRGYTALHLASTREVAELLVQKGLDVNQPGTARETPLYTAADGGHIEVVDFLLAHGANPVARDSDVMPLNVAATRAIAEKLVAAGAPAWGETNKWGRNTPPLWTAASKGRTDVVTFLMEKGIPPPPARGLDEYLSMALFNAVNGRHSAAVEAILERKENRLDARKCDELINQAVHRSDTNTVQAFIAKGVRSTDNYREPLLTAAGNGDAGLSKILLDAGGKTTGSSTGYTPLHAACTAQKGPKENYLACINVLLAAGADPRAATTTSRQTPLHLAAASDFIAAATLLVQKGADVNARDQLSSTPIHWAVINNALETAGFLLANGADANLAVSEKAAIITTQPGEVPNPFGGQSVGAQTPLKLAKSEAMKTLLKKHGATEAGVVAAAQASNPAPAPASPPAVAKKPAAPAQPQPPPTPETRKIQVGDTETDVNVLLGTPQGRKRTGTETLLFFKGGEITIVDGKVTAVSGNPRGK